MTPLSLNSKGGDDRLIIGSATAVVDGGSGSDSYEFHQGFGATTIHNHDISNNRFDVIRLHGVGKIVANHSIWQNNENNAFVI